MRGVIRRVHSLMVVGGMQKDGSCLADTSPARRWVCAVNGGGQAHFSCGGSGMEIFE